MFRLSIQRVLGALELQREKAKDYANVVLMQVIIVVFGITLSGPVVEDSSSALSKFIISLFFLFGATYFILLWDLMRNFTKNRYLIGGIIVVLGGIFLSGMLVEFPYYQFIKIDNRQTYLLTIHTILFPIEVTIISFAIRDIFSGGYLSPDKLWGAACVFLMIGIAFGSLYDLLTVAYPGSLGINTELGFPNYSECVTFSFSILGGIDTNLNTSPLIHRISVIEAVWGNLYAMLIIGKLLGLPRLENKSEL